MPTASEFRAAATSLSVARDELIELLRPLMTSASELVLDGPVRFAVEAAIAVSDANASAGITALEDQIDEAHRRALVCDEYTRAVQVFERSVDPGARLPARPAWWVERG